MAPLNRFEPYNLISDVSISQSRCFPKYHNGKKVIFNYRPKMLAGK